MSNIFKLPKPCLIRASVRLPMCFYVVALLGLCIPAWACAQQVEVKMGPVIDHYGPVFEVSDAYGLQLNTVYRAVLDVSSGPDDVAALNRSIESAARFLNMHARAGVPGSNIQLAVVLHGSAAKDALSNEAYRARFDVENPNDGLLKALSQAGVAIYLCGQTAGFSGYQASDLHGAVTMATSAMTVLTRLQVEGWAVLP